jgi:hypothetical protein
MTVKVTRPSAIGYGTKEQRAAQPVTVRKMPKHKRKAMQAAAPEVRKRAIRGINKGALFA